MTKTNESSSEAKSGGLWAIARNGYIQYDLDTGLLEIYETKEYAQANAKQGDIVGEASVEQVIDCGSIKPLGEL